MKKRILASLLSLCLIVGLLPTAVLAADESGTEGEMPAVCTCTALCAEGSVDETCPVCVEDDTLCAYTAPVEPAEEPGDEPVDEEPTEEPAGEPEGPACAELAGCADDAHDPECPLYVEPEDPADAQDGDKNTYYETDDVTAPVGPTALTPLTDDGMSGNCGAEDKESSVTWVLTENEDGKDTYTLTISGNGAMMDYASASKQPWANKRTSITEVVIGEGVTSLGDYALSGASNLTQIEFSKSSTIETIGKRALEKTALTSMSVPDSVTEMKEQCLGEISTLTSVQIGSGLETPGNWMFYGDNALTTITVDSNNENFFAENGVLFGRDDSSSYHTILLYPAAKTETSYSIPEGTVHIASYAFQNCTNLTSIEIPSTLETYGTETTLSMFQGTNNLERITVASGNPIFMADSSGAWVTRDGKKIVLYPAKSSGTTYTIDAAVEVIVTGAFAGATNLETLYFNAEDASNTDNFSAGSRFSGAGAENGFKVIIGNQVNSIPKSMFNGANITELTIGNSVTEIGSSAFQNCKKIESVTIPDSVQKINGAAFRDCSGMKTLTLGKGLETFSGDQIFNGCTGLETIYYNIPNLQKTSTPSTNSTFATAGRDSGGITVYVGDAVTNFSGLSCEYVKKLVVTGSEQGCILSTTGVGSAALEELVISENVTKIDNNAFIKDYKLKSIVFTGGESKLTEIGTNAFCNEAGSFSADKKQDILIVLPYSNSAIKEYPWNNNQNFHNTRIFILNKTDATFDEESDTAAKEGNIFNGWYTDDSFSTPAEDTTQAGTYYAKWIKLTSNDISLQYGGEKALSEIKIDGVALTDWTSANSNVAKIAGDKLIATGVGETTITANAALARSGETLTVKVKVTPMPITFGKEDGENPQGTITYQYTGMAPDFAQFAKFYPAKVENGKVSIVDGSKSITLTEGTDIVFEYDAGGGKNDYHYLPIDVTENQTYGIEVIVKLVNPNYRFVTESNQTLSETIKENVVVKSGDLKEVSFEGVPAAGETMTYPYNGQPQPPVSNLTRMSAGNIDKFTVHFHPWGDTEFTEAHLENQTVDELTPEAIRKIAPTEPGSYLMIVDGVSETEYAYRSWIFTITKATVTIRPNDKSAYVGDELPTLGADDYTVTGLVGDDTLSPKPTLAYASTPDMNTTGTYAIKASGAEANEAHYTLVYEDGTLTVSRRSSGGGGGGSSSGNTTTETEKNPDGSTTTTVTDKKTGTVTETTKFKDGSTLVVETKKDGTVTTTETAKNGVKVRTVEEPGEDVTAKVTIPKSVGEAVVTIPADVDYGMVAVDADTGEVVKLSVPTREGMTVKLDGSADLVLVDRSRDFTDTRGHWAEDAIDFATAHELFAGTSDTTFTPDSPMTRAMLMTVLARFDGQDTTGGAVWYEKAMAWARENGISDGSNPDGSITREQLATMLWRYAGSPAGDGSAIGRFTDSGKVSSYAVEAMNWAVGTGLFGGMGDGTLAPQGRATRAQVATILMRFVENLTK